MDTSPMDASRAELDLRLFEFFPSKIIRIRESLDQFDTNQ